MHHRIISVVATALIEFTSLPVFAHAQDGQGIQTFMGRRGAIGLQLSDLSSPASSAKGAILSTVCLAHQFAMSIGRGTAGASTCGHPQAADIAGFKVPAQGGLGFANLFGIPVCCGAGVCAAARPSDVSNVLGFMPLNKAGDVINGLGTADTDVMNIIATAKFGVAVDGGTNGIVGAGITRQPNIFPVGVTGYWKMPFVGGVGYALYGQCDLRSAGSCLGAEIDANNYSAAPPTTPPGNWSFGTADNISVGLHIGAGGYYNPGIGLSIGQNGASPRAFETAIYTWPAALSADGTGIFVDSTAILGPKYSARFRNAGGASNINLLLETMGAQTNLQPVIQHTNSSGKATFSITQDGEAYFGSKVQSTDASYPEFRWISSSAGADLKKWSIYARPDGSWHFRALNDNEVISNDFMVVTRTGAVPTGIGFPEPVTATAYQETLTTPASSSASCAAGQFTDDANYHYVCVATNSWKRVALSAF